MRKAAVSFGELRVGIIYKGFLCLVVGLVLWVALGFVFKTLDQIFTKIFFFKKKSVTKEMEPCS